MTADSAYGRDGRFRAFLKSHRMPYVVEVPVRHTITDLDRRRSVDTLISRAPAEAWHRVSAGPGVRGEREYDFAWATLPAFYDVPASTTTKSANTTPGTGRSPWLPREHPIA
ncbi:hypothetical protein [Nocardia sp. NPDC004260]